MAGVWKVYSAHHADLSEQLREHFADHPELGPLIAATPPDPVRDRESLALLGGALEAGDWDAYWESISAQAVGYANAEISLHAWHELIHDLRRRVTGHLFDSLGGDLVALRQAATALDRWLDDAMGVFSQAFVSANERVIERQQRAIRELSTPVLQLRRGLLILPIVGALERERLDQLRRHLLDGIRTRRARAVVLDVTGVPEIDSVAANLLIGAVNSARMMGAELIVSGMSAEIAQTLVTAGIDLSLVTSAGDLESGIEYADRLVA
jgi:anti-anti-sigma factor